MEPDQNKRESFRANERLDAILAELREYLEPVQKRVEERFVAPKWPVGLVVGCPRAGTTLMLQFLASSGAFAYSTNVITRFAYAPYLGALVQRLLFDPAYDFHGDFSDIQSKVNFSSNLGKSKGALAVNEFQHFFRCYLPHFDPQTLSERQCAEIDVARMRRDLASIEHGLGKPFVTKGFMLQFNMAHFSRAIPEFFVLNVQRNELFVMQSLLLGREEYYGSRDVWYSVKPQQYEQLVTMDVYHQIAGQVYFTEKAIDEGLASILPTHRLTIKYEDFCSDPGQVYNRMVQMYAKLGCELDGLAHSPKTFSPANTPRLPEDELTKLRVAYDDFASERVILDA